MTIEGLESLISGNECFTCPFKLHDSTVIIDGSRLMDFIYRFSGLNYTFGGEYKRYSDIVRNYMSIFLECNIKPIVIVDIGYEKTGHKLGTALIKANNTINYAISITKELKSSFPVYPVLISEVFYSVLLELGIPFAISDYSTDNQVAALGNMYKCPIISNDNDLFILDAPNGFIYFDFIQKTVNSEVDSHGKEYKFLSCRIFYLCKFGEIFPGMDKNVLPIFATIMGNDFVNPMPLWNFLQKYKLPEYEGEKLFFKSKRQEIMARVICWLRPKSLYEAVNDVIAYFKVNEQGYVKSVLDTSLKRYKLNPIEVSLIFVNKINDLQDDLRLNSRIAAPCGNKLPEHFLLKYHQDFHRFFIKVIGMHKAFLEPQVENTKLCSSHDCALYIRQIIYGILVRHDINGRECKNKKCLDSIEEYDRFDTCSMRKEVGHLSSVGVAQPLPKLNELNIISREVCISIIDKTLGIEPEHYVGIPNEWRLFIGSIIYWLCTSGCKSISLFYAVLMNVIYFGLIKAKYQIFAHQICPFKDRQYSSCITCIAANVEKIDLQRAEKVLDKYCNLPSSLDREIFLNFSHSFSQLKSCLLYTILLNKLLNNCLKTPNPENCFSGMLMYNITHIITKKQTPKTFSSETLGKNLDFLFNELKSKICANVPDLIPKPVVQLMKRPSAETR